MLRHQQSVETLTPAAGREASARGRAGIAPACTAVFLLLDLGVLHWLMRPDHGVVYVLGRPLQLACAVRARFGRPCPGCGATRGIALSLHGQLGTAWRLFPAAPLAVCGVGVLAAALLGLAWVERCGNGAHAPGVKHWIRSASVGYALASSVIWIAAFLSGAAG